MDDPDDVTLFRRYCLRVDDKSYDTLLNFKFLVYDADTVRLSLTIPILRTITHVLSDILGHFLYTPKEEIGRYKSNHKHRHAIFLNSA